MKPYYQDEYVTLYCGDCLEVMPVLDVTFDTCITDPPYGTTACKWDSVIPFEPMWENLKRLVKSNGAIVLFGSEPFSSMLRLSNVKLYKYDWKWDKKLAGNPLNAKRKPLETYEDIMVFNKHSYYPVMKRGQLRKKGGVTKQPTHTGSVDLGYSSFNDEYYPKSILEFPNTDRSHTIHPTQKPVALIEYLIKTYTNEGESVLDFASGSGTTGVAAKLLNRKCTLIEKEEKYCEIAARRLSQGVLPLFESEEN
jgi:DNA modification methylase